MSQICIVGDILVDISLKNSNTPLKMRLGGIIHAARSLWAMNIDYCIGYFAPSYLDSHIQKYLPQIGCSKILKLGNVQNCPYTMLIDEVKEVGDQGYEFILRDNIKISYDEITVKELSNYDDIFFISGNYDLSLIITNIPVSSKIHYDIANNINDLEELKIDRKFETLFISTSSKIFKNICDNNMFAIESFIGLFETMTNILLLKENRGGSRAYNFKKKKIENIPAQTQKIVHSVGVGDVYDMVYIVLSNKYPLNEALHYSSWIATEYAKTTFPDDFKKMTLRVLYTPITEIISLGGCLLPWEQRRKCHIYIAAPDFDFVNTAPVEIVESCLLYHNFAPHRPIKENGQMPKNATWEEKQSIFEKDMILLNQCNMLIAVLLYNDPGTLIEIGMASERKIPTIVYDPYNIASNCMLTQLPDLVSSDLDEVISEVFLFYSRLID